MNIMLRRKSVNRPLTPDVMENQGKEPTLQELINIERLLELLRERLIECGWKDEMKALCRSPLLPSYFLYT
ncbi:hypothetical protein GBA52_012087 [Prunus armeniaca]|nr:hypothetical protein GBA52_012087 [Prunus armeniaca]